MADAIDARDEGASRDCELELAALRHALRLIAESSGHIDPCGCWAHQYAAETFDIIANRDAVAGGGS
ncbi:MAG: hypothetical protein ACRDZO_07680 [Egibacteraceae bacterium]